MGGPLDGVLVVSVEQAVAAPLATCRLADAGARVIKIERPGAGDFARGYDHAVNGHSAYFVWLNRGKESIALDLTDSADRGVLDRMVARADVFVQNLGPGAAGRAGLGSAALRAAHPALVTCDISGYGPDGPYADERAYDLLVQAESGIASVTGIADAPGRIGVSACDIAAGMSAHAAILEALLGRAHSGEGAAVHVSLFAAMAEWMAVPLLHLAHQGTIWPRVGLAHPLIAPYGAYPTADDALILVGVQNDGEWRRFAERVLGRPELAAAGPYRTNVDRVANRAALDELVGGHLAGRTLEEAAGELRAAGIAYGRVNDVRGLAAHPQLRQVDVPTSSGPVPVAAPPALHGLCSPEPRPVPDLDEHGAALRAEFAG